MLLPSQYMLYWMLTGQTTAVVLKWHRDTAGSPTLSDLRSDDKRPAAETQATPDTEAPEPPSRLDGGTHSQKKRRRRTNAGGTTLPDTPSSLYSR